MKMYIFEGRKDDIEDGRKEGRTIARKNYMKETLFEGRKEGVERREGRFRWLLPFVHLSIHSHTHTHKKIKNIYIYLL